MSLNRVMVAAAIVFAVLSTGVVITPRHASVGLATAKASVNATQAWNQVCSHYEFPIVGPGMAGGTFGAAWNMIPNHTLTIQQALAAITANVNSLMGTGQAPPIIDDTYGATIQNWG